MFNLKEWNEIEYNKFIETLKIIDKRPYKPSYSKVVSSESKLIGIRAEVLREVSSEIVKGDWRGFLRCIKHEYSEENIINGMIIGFIDVSVEEKIELLRDFSNHIDSWATCDIVVSGLKFLKNSDKDRYLGLISELLNAEDKWKIRMGIIILLNYFIDTKKNRDLSMEMVAHIDREESYVKTALAWLYASIFIKDRKVGMEILNEGKLDPWVNNMMIYKLRDSLKVSDEEKRIIKFYEIDE